MDNFKAHLNKFIAVTDGEYNSIFSFFEVVKVNKKQNLMQEGEVCRNMYFVVEGCLRKYFINEKE